jgi:uncharacterized tellurite resistance protein B-like protein
MTLNDRKQLVRLACVAAWSDLDLAEEERSVILHLAMEMALPVKAMDQVMEWLESPPADADPTTVAVDHRERFMEALWTVVLADGRFDPAECQTMGLIRELMFA